MSFGSVRASDQARIAVPSDAATARSLSFGLDVDDTVIGDDGQSAAPFASTRKPRRIVLKFPCSTKPIAPPAQGTARGTSSVIASYGTNSMPDDPQTSCPVALIRWPPMPQSDCAELRLL